MRSRIFTDIDVRRLYLRDRVNYSLGSYQFEVFFIRTLVIENAMQDASFGVLGAKAVAWRPSH